LWSSLRRLPRPARSAIGAGFGSVPAGAWDGLARLLPGKRRPPHFGTKVRKGLRLAGASGLEDVFASFLDEWSGEASPVLGGGDSGLCAFDLDVGADAPDAVRMMYCDAMSYLPDDILCKVDRAAMAVSLETRVPFLDHRVAELAARIPIGMKIRGGKGKHILRQTLYREAPRALFERPKAGFAVPVGEWIKGPLRDWAESLLNEKRLREEGYFNPAQVRARWAEHLSGRREATPTLWAILMFQAWRTAEVGHSRSASAEAA
jgi:asparagine synthase (glutamine-hydrolysing)